MEDDGARPGRAALLRLAVVQAAPRLLPPGVTMAQFPVRVVWRCARPRQPFNLMLAGLVVVEDE